MITRREFIEGTGAFTATTLIDSDSIRIFVATEETTVQRSFIFSPMLTIQSVEPRNLFSSVKLIIDEDQVTIQVGNETVTFTEPVVLDAFHVIQSLGIEHGETWADDEA